MGQMTIALEPPKPVKSVVHLCHNKYNLDPVQEVFESEEKQERFGITVVDGNGALFGQLQGTSAKALQEISNDLPTKHRRGGQSQNRFARLHDEKVQRYLRKVAETATRR